jgi:hypothetical protein
MRTEGAFRSSAQELAYAWERRSIGEATRFERRF